MSQSCINSLSYKIEQTARICKAFCDTYFKEYALGEITYDEFIILDTILSNPNICQRDLAKLVLKGTSHISKILKTLEKKELIQRPIDKKGNRVVRKIIITENGLNLHSFAAQIALDFANKIETIIGPNATINCSNYLDRIKEIITQDKKIIFE